MRSHLRDGLLAILCFMAMAGSMKAQETGPATTKFLAEMEEPSGSLPSASALAPEELMLRMGHQIETTDLDCSHFVQWLYEQAGLYYGYAPSRTLYAGMAGFRRVSHPLPGDLIVWPGHVGIVVDPDEQTFLSSLRSGVKTASYTSRYWKRRGHARFYRYMSGQGHFENRWQSVSSQSHGHSASGAE